MTVEDFWSSYERCARHQVDQGHPILETIAGPLVGVPPDREVWLWGVMTGDDPTIGIVLMSLKVG